MISIDNKSNHQTPTAEYVGVNARIGAKSASVGTLRDGVPAKPGLLHERAYDGAVECSRKVLALVLHTYTAHQ